MLKNINAIINSLNCLDIAVVGKEVTVDVNAVVEDETKVLLT